jgi:undecaprenyl-phosphate 4-deoxy-4-formamido-L-arabinose transferase
MLGGLGERMVDEDPRPEFSVVVTCHFEEDSIDAFHGRLRRTLDGLGRSHELILVNDGSTDGTLARLRAIFERDRSVSVLLDLYKNSGQAVAITAGCVEARGRNVVLIDSDLQLDPEDLPRLVAEFDKGFDVVSGYRVDRQDSLWRRAASRLANVVMRRVSRAPFRDFGCTFKILDGRLVRAFEPGPLRPLRPPYLIAAAQRCSELPVSHHARPHGHSGWTLDKLLAYNMDNVVGLSRRPFQMLSTLCFLAGLLLVLRVLVSPLLPGPILGEVSNGLLLNALVVSLLLIVGVSSLIGEYVLRTYLTSQSMPAYIVRKAWRRTPGADAGVHRDV